MLQLQRVNPTQKWHKESGEGTVPPGMGIRGSDESYANRVDMRIGRFTRSCPGFFLHKESFLVRIQCKSAWLSKDGAYMEFNTHMPSSKKRRGEKRGYAGKAEYFGVYCPEIGKVYMVSVDIAPKTAMHLRFKSAGRRVGNSRDGFKQRSYEEVTDSRIYWAEDFEI